jgi:diacylglycerol kinase (ATP)
VFDSPTFWIVVAVVVLVIVVAVVVARRDIVLEATGIARRRRRPHRDDFRQEGFDEEAPPLKRAGVVVNPTKFADAAAVAAVRAKVTAMCRAQGWGEPLWYETTIADPGTGQAHRAVEEGAAVVCPLGGDGTVRAVATALVGTETPLGLLPGGTGNLLARNLELPVDDVSEAVRIALTGADRTIDVGACGDHRFVIMAGLGFDAAMMRDAPDKLKARVGWPAYVVSASKHLRGRRTQVTLTIDDEPPINRRVRTIVVGNVGKLQGGIPLMPDARPDDGILDVVVIAPRNVVDWARVAVTVLTRRHRPDFRVERFRCRRVRIEAAQAMPQQLDGEVIGEGREMDIEVQPGALVVRVPGEDRRR